MKTAVGNLGGQHMMAWGGVSVVEAWVTSLKAARENKNKQHYSSVVEETHSVKKTLSVWNDLNDVDWMWTLSIVVQFKLSTGFILCLKSWQKTGFNNKLMCVIMWSDSQLLLSLARCIHTCSCTSYDSISSSQSPLHLREFSVDTHLHLTQVLYLSAYRAPKLFLGVIDGWQKIPQGVVIKQEVKRVSEQSRSWLTPPPPPSSQQLTDLLLQRRQERREQNEREP